MSFLFSQPKGWWQPPTVLRETSTSRKIATCLLFIYPHLAHSLPVYGIISRCPMYRIQVASDSASNLSSSSLLLEFIWSDQKFNNLFRGIKSGLWAELNPRPSFHRGFASQELLFPVETQVFLVFQIYKILTVTIIGKQEMKISMQISLLLNDKLPPSSKKSILKRNNSYNKVKYDYWRL